MRVGGDAAAKVGADERAFNDLPVAIGDHGVPHFQFIDYPTIGPAEASLRLALGGDGGGHVGPARHELCRQRTAGKGPFDVESLPAAFKLVGVALAAPVIP